MEEDFYQWHIKKQEIDKLGSNPNFFAEREIWWCHFGRNIGREYNGKGPEYLRPILILRKYSRELCLVVPLSKQVKKGNYFFYLLSESNIIRTAVLHHIKAIDARRLTNKIDHVSTTEFTFIKRKITALLQ